MTRSIRMIMALGLLVLLGMAPEVGVRKAALESLDPAEPSGYIEMAETVADTAGTQADRRLAVRLYALGATLDPERWGRSGMLGVLSLLEEEDQIRRLRVLLELQDESRPRLLPKRRIVIGSQTQASIAAFDILSAIRSGDVRAAQSLLRRTGGVRELLEQYEDQIPGGMSRLLDRVTNAQNSAPIRLTGAEYVAQLQIQSHLLGGRSDTWSATLSAWQGRPLEAVEHSDLGHVLELDLTKTVWSDGWIRP